MMAELEAWIAGREEVAKHSIYKEWEIGIRPDLSQIVVRIRAVY
jgi:hypothetical protein